VGHRRANRRAIERGSVMRASDCLAPRGGRGGKSVLLPAVPGCAAREGPVDAAAVAAELARLIALARRGSSG
jgi:hypothetical protein